MITNEDIKVVISLKVRCNKEVRKYLNDYIAKQETLQAEHEALRKEHLEEELTHSYDVKYMNEVVKDLTSELEALKKDVARYFELESRIKEYDFVTVEDKQEYFRLHSKLSKVGKEL